MQNGKSSFTASNLKITGNTAATNGGGICIPGTKDYEYNVSLENVLIQGNKVSPEVVQVSVLHELGRRKLLPEF